ncbi:Uncharacterised protein [Shigella sonnei]|nr:Uncharacterised protein [Shigella sonnei]
MVNYCLISLALTHIPSLARQYKFSFTIQQIEFVFDTEGLIQALRIDVFLKRSQCCLVADNSVPDTENVSSSN